ncbi:hypothetical protein [Geminicoccus harenae]|uniref:hypothetical protein n=1 Tax=Geminicoccus harenae TaxID=2498453 RepID=UPI001C9854E7|nr:hypothetical protein [Geminicoccus harenae]
MAPRRSRISRTSRVQVSIRDQDHHHLETLARILDADDAVAERLRNQIEQILAEDACPLEDLLAPPGRHRTRH